MGSWFISIPQRVLALCPGIIPARVLRVVVRMPVNQAHVSWRGAAVILGCFDPLPMRFVESHGFMSVEGVGLH